MATVIQFSDPGLHPRSVQVQENTLEAALTVIKAEQKYTAALVQKDGLVLALGDREPGEDWTIKHTRHAQPAPLTGIERELLIEQLSEGDPRRCPRHPQVQTSSPDGLHDAPCGQCELEHEAGSFDELEEAPELGPAFFEEAILVRPGESLIERLDEERHDRFANDLKPRG